MGAGLSVLHFAGGSVESARDGVVGLRAAADQPLAQLVDAGGRDEQVAGVQLGLRLHGLHALHVDVQNALLALFDNVLHGAHGGAVVVAAELRPLDEAALLDHLLERLRAREVVVAPVHLPGPRRARRRRHAEPERLRKLREQLLEQRGFPRAARPTHYYQ